MRNNYFTQLTVQFDNPVQPPQWGAPVLITSVAVITNEQGQAVYQPAHRVEPAVADDITDAVLAALQDKFAAIGLEVKRRA